MSRDRHERDCTICKHPRREEIEREFCDWEPPTYLARTYRVSRNALYRHAGAKGLVALREKNVKASLARFIERCSKVRPTAAAFVAAVVALSKINEKGETIDRVVSTSDLTHAFESFTRGELERFVTTGELPAWYRAAVNERIQ